MNKRFYFNRNFFIIILVLLILIISISIFGEKHIRPIITQKAQYELEKRVTQCVNTAITDYLKDNNVEYFDVSVIGRDSNSRITSVEINTNYINAQKSVLVDSINRRISNSKEKYVSVPLGTLTGAKWAIGFGPTVKFKVNPKTFVNADYDSVFYSAGINNMLHRITVNISCEYYICVPWDNKKAKYNTSFILAETVIVGEIPDNFTSVYDGKDDVVGDINDFGTQNN